jgi:hypothetical protein
VTSRRAGVAARHRRAPRRRGVPTRPPVPSRLVAAVLLTAGVALAPATLPASSAQATAPGPTPGLPSSAGGSTSNGSNGSNGNGGSDGVGSDGVGGSGLREVLNPAAAAATRGQPAPPSAPGAISTADQERVARYWTAQRRERAFGAHSATRLTVPAGTRPFADGAKPAGPSAPPPPSTGTPYTGGGLVTATTGRLFSTIGGADFACSASVVTSPGRDLVVTAGHCLHGGAGSQFAQNVAFVPGYSDGTLPYGIWTARRVTVTPAWSSGSNFDVDAGFALLNTQGGRRIQDVVGAQGIAFHLPNTLTQYSFGYPRLLPYDGRHLIYCAGPGSADPYGGPSIGVSCRMTAGASGGPFLAGIGQLGPGRGWVDGVVSYAYSGSVDRLYGTHFGDVIRLLYYQSAQL